MTRTLSTTRRDLLRHGAFHASALLLLALLAGPAAGATLLIDPGPVGSPANVPLTTIPLDASAPANEVWIEFDNMKHVAATEWGFLLNLNTGDQDDAAVSWDFFLSDENGNEIPATRESGNAVVTTGFSVTRTPEPGTASVIAHDIHLLFGWDPADVGLATVHVFVLGEVGEWSPVPVPAAAWLLGPGLVSLLIAGRRAR